MAVLLVLLELLLAPALVLMLALVLVLVLAPVLVPVLALELETAAGDEVPTKVMVDLATTTGSVVEDAIVDVGQLLDGTGSRTEGASGAQDFEVVHSRTMTMTAPPPRVPVNRATRL